MKITINSLVLEVTRRCNWCCDHCLRGDQQKIDMPLAMVDKVLNLIDEIYEVTFTGGEPTLNLPVMQYFFERSRALGKQASYFFVATNGQANQMELATILLDAYSDIEEPEACGVCVSQDVFHPYQMESFRYEQNPLRGLAFYCKGTKAHPANADPDTWCLRVGKAYENGMGRLPVNINEQNITVNGNEDDPIVTIDTLYISANGNITVDCNMPYEDIDEFPITTVDKMQQYLADCVAAAVSV